MSGLRGGDYAVWISAMSEAIARQDQSALDAAMAGFDIARGAEVSLEVRRVAQELQTALDRFRIDTKLIDLAQRQVPDARHRLAHVLRLTDDAAHRTMDLVEQCCPLADGTAAEAARLGALLEAGAATTPLGEFLRHTATAMAAVRRNLAEVLLAQGYQDLSGQIIRGVMTLVDELEAALGELVRIAGPCVAAREEPETDSRGVGPVVPGVSHGNAVSGQTDVDALLSDLGV
jgi:chemotaxis protein CheZ